MRQENLNFTKQDTITYDLRQENLSFTKQDKITYA